MSEKYIPKHSSGQVKTGPYQLGFEAKHSQAHFDRLDSVDEATAFFEAVGLDAGGIAKG